MITKLTPEQEAQIPVFIQKWVDKASEPIDRKKLPSVVKRLFGEDKVVVVGESLQNTIDLIKVATAGKPMKRQLRSQLRSQLDSQLGSQLRSQLYSQLDSQLGSQLRSQLYSQLGSQLYSQLGSQLDSQLDSQLRSQLYSQLDSQLYSQLDFYIGLWWATWNGWYDYGKYIGVQFDEEKLQLFNDYQDTMPIAIFVGNVIFVVEKPTVSWSNTGMLHDPKLAAIRWKDGTGFYYLNSVSFNKELFDNVTSGTMPFEDILKIADVDQRTQAMRFGNVWDFIKFAKAKELDTYTKTGSDGRQIRYWLYEFPANPDLFPKGAKYMVYDDSMVGGTVQIPLTGKLGENKFAIVDTLDAERTKRHTWWLSKGRNTNYAWTRINGKQVRLHQFIYGVQQGKIIDHIDGNGLNNSKANLRHVTSSQNLCGQKARGSSSFKGVTWNKKEEKWYVFGNNENRYLGSFISEHDAAKAYDEYAKKEYGEFARLNFPETSINGYASETVHMQGVPMEFKSVPEAMGWKVYRTPAEWEAMELDVHFT